LGECTFRPKKLEEKRAVVPKIHNNSPHIASKSRRFSHREIDWKRNGKAERGVQFREDILTVWLLEGLGLSLQ
jgi:hypothetical protein